MAVTPIIPEQAPIVEETYLCSYAQRADREANRRYDGAIRQIEWPKWQSTFLTVLDCEEMLSVSAPCRVPATDLNTIRTDHMSLQQRGLSIFYVDPEDRRIRPVVIGENGRRPLAGAFPLGEEVQLEYSRQLDGLEHAAYRSARNILSTWTDSALIWSRRQLVETAGGKSTDGTGIGCSCGRAASKDDDPLRPRRSRKF